MASDICFFKKREREEEEEKKKHSKPPEHTKPLIGWAGEWAWKWACSAPGFLTPSLPRCGMQGERDSWRPVRVQGLPRGSYPHVWEPPEDREEVS